MIKLPFKILIIFIVLIAASFGSIAQLKYKAPSGEQVKALINSDTKYIVNLGGNWELSTNGEDWSGAYVPGIQADEDRVYLRRTIKIEKNLIGQLTWQLYFLGIDEDVEVYFNEQFIGKYLGGMTPFKVDLPKRLFFGEVNNIKLIVSGAQGSTRKIKEQNIFARRFYTGSLREIFLIGNPNIFVNSIFYSTEYKNQTWTVKSKVDLSSGDISNFVSRSARNDSLNNLGIAKTFVQVEGFIRNKLTGQQIAYLAPKNIEVEGYRTASINFEMTAINPSLWSPDNPNLYELTFKISRNGSLIDIYSVNMGFASYYVQKIEKRPNLMINGKLLNIKGVDYVENYLDGRAVTFQKMENDIKYIKSNLGANLIRVKYGTPHPYIAELCDRYGLLLLIELPVYDVPKVLIGLDEVQVKLRNLAERYIEFYGIYPSVAGFGSYDGVQESARTTLKYADKIYKIFKEANNKLVYKTVRFGSATVNTNSADFVCLRDNRKFNTIDDIKAEISRLVHLSESKPVVLCYGYPIQPENHSGYSDPLSIEAQSYYIMNIFHVEQNKGLSGSIISSFSDYLLNNPLLSTNNPQQYLCSSGLLDFWGKQRLSLTTVRSLFNNEKEPQMNAGSYSESTPLSYIIIGILVSILVVYYLNRYKRTREYFIRAFIRPFNFFADIRDQRIISNIQTLMLGFVIALTIGIYISSILHYYKTEFITQLILLLFIPFKVVQEFLFRAIWMPELLLLILTLFFMGIFSLIALFIRLVGFAFRRRIYLKDTFTIVIWSMTPVIILLPFSVVMVRLLLFSPGFLWITFILFLLVSIWAIFRIIKAVGVVFDSHPSKTYAIGFTIAAILIISVLSLYQIQFSIFDYTEFIFTSLIR